MISTCNQNCDTCIKKRYSIFAELSDEAVNMLHAHRYVVNFSKGDLIFKEGSKPSELMCMQSGKVKVIRESAGKEIVVGLYGPGDLIGFNTFLNDKLFNSSAIAMEDTSICYIRKDDFYNVFKENNELALRIISIFSQQMEMCQKRMLTLTQSNLRGRLADALIVMMEIYGTKTDGSLNVAVPRRDIASIANMTTANAIRTLSEFRKEKVIEMTGHSIKLIDTDKLEMMRKYQ